MSGVSRQIHLRSRPVGEPQLTDFDLVERPLHPLRAGQVLIENSMMSVEPYMRKRLDAATTYVEPFRIDKALSGPAVGQVVDSADSTLPVGSWVFHHGGWRDVATVAAAACRPIDIHAADPTAYLGVLGLPGLTAWVGVTQIGAVRSGDTVFVSAAAGSVGSLAGQIARLRGARVIGSAGSRAKVDWIVDELGFDAGINYRDGMLAEQLAKAAPEGIDVYFDNVGQDHLQAAIATANHHARFVMCGSVSDYNDAVPMPGPSNLFEIVARRLKLQGFIISDHEDMWTPFLAEVGGWLRDGSVAHHETVVEGLEQAPSALISLLSGQNLGKMLVRPT